MAIISRCRVQLYVVCQQERDDEDVADHREVKRQRSVEASTPPQVKGMNLDIRLSSAYF